MRQPLAYSGPWHPGTKQSMYVLRTIYSKGKHEQNKTAGLTNIIIMTFYDMKERERPHAPSIRLLSTSEARYIKK